MKNLFLILVILLSASLAFSQAVPQPSATPPVTEDDDVVKITTALIQLDVVVTDKNGKLVTDLKPEDFEVTENGERQTVTNLSYFSGQKLRTADGSLTMTTGVANVGNLQNAAAPTAGEVRRTVAVVVDDAGLTPQTLPPVKKDLIKFINEQLQPGDLVAIIRTSSSIGILQQFTTDKKKLLSVVEDLQIRPANNPEGLSTLGTIGISFTEQISTITSGGGLADKGKTPIFQQKNSVESFADINRNLQVTSGALGVLNSTIGAMSGLPGRKSVLYVAHGVDSIFNYNNANMSSDKNIPTSVALIFSDIDKLREKLRGITEFANRSAISIFSYDPRGAQPISLSADVATRGGMFDSMTSAQLDDKISTTSNTFRNSQQGLKFLAEETGGKAYINTNDLGKSLRETLESQNGYYIIGYQPDADSFDANTRRFNKLAVRVKRPGVNVSYRSGFFNVAEASENSKVAPDTGFMQKIFSPYSYNEINVKATSIFAADEKAATVRMFIGIKPEDLQFTANAMDNTKTALFDVVAVAFDADGVPTAQIAKRFEIKATPKDYEELTARGITYNLTFATRTKGAQQIKIAVRDANSNRTGTTVQTVDVPDFDKSALNLSGLLLQNYTMQEWQTLTSGKAAAPPMSAAESASRMQTDTARRQFKKGTVLSFNYAVYAASSLRSKSQAQFTVFKDGKELFKGAAEELNIASTGKMQRINRGGAFLLGTDMPAGKYVLQITVGGDALKKAEIQQIDFELVN